MFYKNSLIFVYSGLAYSVLAWRWISCNFVYSLSFFFTSLLNIINCVAWLRNCLKGQSNKHSCIYT